jgi:O-methyltransferase
VRADDYTKMLGEITDVILASAPAVGIVGLTPTAAQLIKDLRALGLEAAVKGLFAERATDTQAVGGIPVLPIADLGRVRPDVLVIAEDQRKELLLRTALPFLPHCPRIILGGYGHFAFSNPSFSRIAGSLLVPSLANGYPNTLIHLYQCLLNADRLGLVGVVAEFGMFKGGTTMFLSRVVEQLGQGWKVIGFDTFDGFPPPRSPLDMYAHPDCIFTDVSQSRRYLEGRNVEIIEGDIVVTASRLVAENVVLTFMDTDNYTSAMAALDVVQERTAVGGAIVFDHVTGVDRFLYTLGERMAATRLLEDPRYFHLHGTGVFYRQR